MKRIHFYISNNNHHWQMMKPVIELLNDNDGISVTLISLCEFRRMDTPVIELQRMGVAFERLASLKSRVTNTSTGRKHIGGNKGIVRNLMREVLWVILLKRKLKEINSTKPDLVIVPNDIAYPFNKICIWFKKQRINFALMQEGIRFPLPNEEGRLGYGTNGANMILAWGEHSANYFRNLKGASTKVIPVGNPRFDDLLQIDYSKEIKEVHSSFGEKLILYVSNPVDDQGFCTATEKINLFRKFIDKLLPIMIKENISILVRLHPREDIALFKEVAATSDFCKRIHFVQHNNLFALLKSVKIAVILASTVGLESMLCETPVAVVKLPRHGYIFDYVSSGCAMGIDVDSDFAISLLNIIDDRQLEFKKKCSVYTADKVSYLKMSKTVIGEYLKKAMGV